jgi:virginiamycin A acetyltransferase
MSDREPRRRTLVRTMVVRTFQILVSPLIAASWVEQRWGGVRWFAACAELLSLVPGTAGSMTRKAFYAASTRGCAERAYLSFGVLLVWRSVSIGDDVYIGPYSVIGSATIARGVKIASRVSIMSGRHQHGRHAPSSDARPQLQPVSIGVDSWIGEGAIVMADVGERCIVGAGSVVVHPVADGEVVAGNPARPLVQPMRQRAAR